MWLSTTSVKDDKDLKKIKELEDVLIGPLTTCRKEPVVAAESDEWLPEGLPSKAPHWW